MFSRDAFLSVLFLTTTVLSWWLGAVRLKGAFGTTSPAASEAVLGETAPKATRNSFGGEALGIPAY
jgi:hypothetical protein